MARLSFTGVSAANSTSKLATVTASGNTKIGVAVEAAGAGVASIKVRLSGF